MKKIGYKLTTITIGLLISFSCSLYTMEQEDPFYSYQQYKEKTPEKKLTTAEKLKRKLQSTKVWQKLFGKKPKTSEVEMDILPTTYKEAVIEEEAVPADIPAIEQSKKLIVEKERPKHRPYQLIPGLVEPSLPALQAIPRPIVTLFNNIQPINKVLQQEPLLENIYLILLAQDSRVILDIAALQEAVKDSTITIMQTIQQEDPVLIQELSLLGGKPLVRQLTLIALGQEFNNALEGLQLGITIDLMAHLQLFKQLAKHGLLSLSSGQIQKIINAFQQQIQLVKAADTQSVMRITGRSPYQIEPASEAEQTGQALSQISEKTSLAQAATEQQFMQLIPQQLQIKVKEYLRRRGLFSFLSFWGSPFYKSMFALALNRIVKKTHIQVPQQQKLHQEFLNISPKSLQTERKKAFVNLIHEDFGPAINCVNYLGYDSPLYQAALARSLVEGGPLPKPHFRPQPSSSILSTILKGSTLREFLPWYTEEIKPTAPKPQFDIKEMLIKSQVPYQIHRIPHSTKQQRPYPWTY